MKLLLLRDKTWIENNKGWFVSTRRNGLFEIELDTGVCKLLTLLPDYAFDNWRTNPGCIKYRDRILCIPVNGDRIWDYDMVTEEIVPISVTKDNRKGVLMYCYWVVGDILYAVSISYRQIFVIDLNLRTVIDTITITTRKVELRESIMEGDSIYTVSQSEPVIYEYNIITRNIIEHSLNDVKSNLSSIVFDGENFWLSGSSKEIFIWNKECNTIKTIRDFPVDFGRYILGDCDEKILDLQLYDFEERIFSYSVNSSKYIWFIPYRANKILYVNKENFQVNSFEIDEEVETRESLARKKIQDRYFLQYVNEELMSLYSVKNNKVLEINMEKLTWRYKEDLLNINNGKCRGKHNSEIINSTIFPEWEKVFFWSLLCRGE